VKARVGPKEQEQNKDGSLRKKLNCSYLTGVVLEAVGPQRFRVRFLRPDGGTQQRTLGLKQLRIVDSVPPELVAALESSSTAAATTTRSTTTTGGGNERRGALPAEVVTHTTTTTTTTGNEGRGALAAEASTAAERTRATDLAGGAVARGVVEGEEKNNDDDDDDSSSDVLLATLRQRDAGEAGVVVGGGEDRGDESGEQGTAGMFNVEVVALTTEEEGEDSDDVDAGLEDDIIVTEAADVPLRTTGAGSSAAASNEDSDNVVAEGLETTDAHIAKLTQSKAERQNLINAHHTVTVGAMTWRVIESSVAPPLEEYDQVGVRRASFRDFKQLKQSLKGLDTKLRKHGPKVDATKKKVKLYPYQNIFLALWPGNWKKQLRQLNEEIEKAQSNSNGSQKKGIRVVKPVSRKEWWRFIALIIAASVVGYGGHRLWESESSRAEDGRRQFSELPNFGRYMPLRRFEEIRKFFENSFYDRSRSSGDSFDPWWPVIGLIESFNRRRQRRVLASIIKVLDEMMSAFVPRTSRFGGFPNISYIQRKPEPLGTELKVTCCATTGIAINLEVQRGKAGMQSTYPDEQREHGATAACTLRGAVATRTCAQKPPHKRCLVYGDSWFASVKVRIQKQNVCDLCQTLMLCY